MFSDRLYSLEWPLEPDDNTYTVQPPLTHRAFPTHEVILTFSSDLKTQTLWQLSYFINIIHPPQEELSFCIPKTPIKFRGIVPIVQPC